MKSRVTLIGIVLVSILQCVGRAAEPEDRPPVLAPDLPKLLNEREVLTQRVVSLRSDGKALEAVAAAQKVVALTREAFGNAHSQMGGALQQLATVQEEADDWAAAQATWQEVIDLAIQLFGESHYRVKDARLALRHVQVLARLEPDDRRRLDAARQRLREADRLAQANQPESALHIYLELAKLQRQLLGDKDPDFAAALNNIAVLYRSLGNYDRAETYYRQAVAIKKEVRGELNPDYALSLNNLASLYMDRGDFAQAAQLLEQATNIVKQTLGDRHEHYARSLNNLGMVYLELADYAKAEPLFKQAMVLEKAHLGERNRDYATTLNNLGLLYLQRADYIQAELYFQRSLEIVKGLVGLRHLDYAQSVGNLAVLYERTGDYARSVQLLREALEIKKVTIGERHPDYATSLDNLAATYTSMGEYTLAEPMYQQALKIRHETLGPNHPDCAGTLNNLAGLYAAMADNARAEPLRREALRIVGEALGEKHPAYATQLNNLASFYGDLGDYASAGPLYRQALEIRREALGEKHPHYAGSLNNLASFYEATGDKVQAEPLLLQALNIRKEALGVNHPDYGESLNNLGSFYMSTGQAQRALPMYREALQIRQDSLGEKHPFYAQSLHNLAVAYESLGDYTSALRLLEKSMEIHSKALGETHPEYAGDLGDIAIVYEELGEYGRAEKLHRQALELRKQTLGDKHPQYAFNLINLALLYFRMGDYESAEPLCREAVEIRRQLVDDTSAVLSERQQMAMAASLRGTLDCYLSVAFAAQLPGENAYRHVLAWKGGVFARQYVARLGRDQAENREAFAEFEALSRRLATKVFAMPPPARQEAWSREVAELTKQKERLEAEMAGRNPEFQRLRTRLRITPQQFQAVLPKGVVLVDFLEYTRRTPQPDGKGPLQREVRLVAFVVSHDQPIIQLDLGAVAPIVKAVERWREAIAPARGGRGFDFAHPQVIPTAAASDVPSEEVRRLIWEPVEKHLSAARIVVVSPDGVIARCPLAALPGRKRGTYLLEEVSLATLAVPQMLPEWLEPSTATGNFRGAESLLLVGAVDYAADPKSLADASLPTEFHPRAVVGATARDFPPLPGTAREIESVARVARQFRGATEVKVLSQAAATEEAVRDQAPARRYVHLATHGFFAPPQILSAFSSAMWDPHATSDPGLQIGSIDRTIAGFHPGLLSGLVLAGANRGAGANSTGTLADDGILTASEMASLDLRGTDLVVLSACETGLGAVAGGEGVLGLQRALQLSGAQTVVASLWRVSDAATEALMSEFYRNLWDRKLSKLEALRQAQLTVLRGFDVAEGRLRPAGSSTAANKNAAHAPDRLPPQFWAAFVLSGDWR